MKELITKEQIKKMRENRENICEIEKVGFLKKKLNVKINNQEYKDLTPEEAVAKFGTNYDFIQEFRYLFNDEDGEKILQEGQSVKKECIDLFMKIIEEENVFEGVLTLDEIRKLLEQNLDACYVVNKPYKENVLGWVNSISNNLYIVAGEDTEILKENIKKGDIDSISTKKLNTICHEFIHIITKDGLIFAGKYGEEKGRGLTEGLVEFLAEKMLYNRREKEISRIIVENGELSRKIEQIITDIIAEKKGNSRIDKAIKAWANQEEINIEDDEKLPEEELIGKIDGILKKLLIEGKKTPKEILENCLLSKAIFSEEIFQKEMLSKKGFEIDGEFEKILIDERNKLKKSLTGYGRHVAAIDLLLGIFGKELLEVMVNENKNMKTIIDETSEAHVYIEDKTPFVETSNYEHTNLKKVCSVIPKDTLRRYVDVLDQLLEDNYVEDEYQALRKKLANEFVLKTSNKKKFGLDEHIDIIEYSKYMQYGIDQYVNKIPEFSYDTKSHIDTVCYDLYELALTESEDYREFESDFEYLTIIGFDKKSILNTMLFHIIENNKEEIFDYDYLIRMGFLKECDGQEIPEKMGEFYFKDMQDFKKFSKNIEELKSNLDEQSLKFFIASGLDKIYSKDDSQKKYLSELKGNFIFEDLLYNDNKFLWTNSPKDEDIYKRISRIKDFEYYEVDGEVYIVDTNDGLIISSNKENNKLINIGENVDLPNDIKINENNVIRNSSKEGKNIIFTSEKNQKGKYILKAYVEDTGKEVKVGLGKDFCDDTEENDREIYENNGSITFSDIKQALEKKSQIEKQNKESRDRD